MKNITIIALLLLSFLIISANFSDPQDSSKFVLVLDAGHGGLDPGCIGVFSKEKEVVLDVSLRLKKLIERMHPDVEVVLTRGTDDFIPLHERADISNEKNADLFISIHCNASVKKHIKGSETYVLGKNGDEENLLVAMRENSVILNEEGYQEKYDGFDPTSPIGQILLSNYQHSFKEQSLKCAGLVETMFQDVDNWKSRGVKQAGFLVLVQTNMPSILIEIGFLSNKEEEKYLNSELGKERVVTNIYRAFRDYKESVGK
ncbi:N-acetylmuramoyl-L-alanine amidase [Flammeovirgaceae bacterium SG7u.111]|nr:N-acetylmuramoyl-L-alanine amidase [Flammeovirgaceae bacterium SG7u.132]WPO38506.1 N-acetylmuramoyl-L-alanine amidase [Flammeovirgaceae bacterium SG7u.111]